MFGRFSFAQYESRNDIRPFALLLGSLTDSPFRNLAFNWNRVFSSSLVNEAIVGYNRITIVTKALDWAGIGTANATFGIGGGQPIPGLSSIGWGGGLTTIGTGASDTDTLDQTYQFNDKVTWFKGDHGLKIGGQLLHYSQRRVYAGNNGLLGIFGYGGAFTDSRSPISCSIRSATRDAAASRIPGRNSTIGSQCSFRMISRRRPPSR